MTQLIWNDSGEKRYRKGIDRGVIWFAHDPGVAWNGLVDVRGSNSGQEPKFYQQNGVRTATVVPGGIYGAEISAFTYPDEFELALGGVTTAANRLVRIHNQTPVQFHFSYREGLYNEHGRVANRYHFVYRAKVRMSGYASGTLESVNEIEPMTFAIDTTPIRVNPELGLTSRLTVDYPLLPADELEAFEKMIYGDPEDAKAPPPVPSPSLLISQAGQGNTPTGDLFTSHYEHWF